MIFNLKDFENRGASQLPREELSGRLRAQGDAAPDLENLKISLEQPEWFDVGRLLLGGLVWGLVGGFGVGLGLVLGFGMSLGAFASVCWLRGLGVWVLLVFLLVCCFFSSLGG